MFKSTVTLVALLLSATILFAQKGVQFPEMPCESLDNQTVVIPTDTKDKLTIVGMAYSKKAESALKSWYTPMYDKFILKRGIFDAMYDVNFFFVPMYTGTKKMAFEISMKKMRESNRKDLYPYLLFYKGGLEPYVEVLNMKEKNLPYLFVIDQEGKVVYYAKGLYTEKKMEDLEEVLDSFIED
ncbi:MAG: hypothetical protein P8H59_06765 [Flavobacteriales bacterium]|nr:hypothetical protein [Flavobacteriales bacterium]MDG2244973.1 hypothetical protein [Flavobacteriales bacterium]